MMCIHCGKELEPGTHVYVVVEELRDMENGMALCKEIHETETMHIDCAKDFLDYV